MAYTDDYEVVGAPADNFDCDATAGWTVGAVGDAVALNTTGEIQGTGCLDLSSGAGTASWFNDVTAGSRFKITEKDLGFWFFYSKGKGANYLTEANSAVVIRLFFGGTTIFADYFLTEQGDLSLDFGWQFLQCSGKELNGGAIGGGHNNGSDWDLDIHRVELRLDFENANNAGLGGGTPLRIDYFTVGTTVTISEGTRNSPSTISDLEDYLLSTRTDGPIGVISVDDVFINLLCGIEIGNGSSGNNNEGHLKIDNGFVLFNQASEDVKHNLTINEFSSLQCGNVENGNDADYTVDGVQLALPPNRFSDIILEDGGILELFDCKVFRWRDVFVGGGTSSSSESSGSTCSFIDVDIDTCETVYLNSTNLTIQNSQIHDNSQNIRPQAVEVFVTPDSITNFRVFNSGEGTYFRNTVELREFIATDNTTYDVGIQEGETATLISSRFNDDKIRRIT